MKKQIETPVKTALAMISTQKPPTEAEIAKALAPKRPLPGDIALMQSLEIENEVDKYEPIVLSDTWYEFLPISSASIRKPLASG
ncbi:MAG TPA: hypothetical protein VIJ95_09685 [Hanamia sp.]